MYTTTPIRIINFRFLLRVRVFIIIIIFLHWSISPSFATEIVVRCLFFGER